jgi:hypothetical protein
MAPHVALPEIEKMPCFRGSAPRGDVLKLLRPAPGGGPSVDYAIRYCSDPAELVDGKPNPDLFVVVFLGPGAQGPATEYYAKMFRYAHGTRPIPLKLVARFVFVCLPFSVALVRPSHGIRIDTWW